MSGSRIALPADALKVCARCGAARGTRTKGWQRVVRGGAQVGWTCPDCPRADEPIRLKQGRFYAVVAVRKGGKRQQLTRRFDYLTDAREWVAEVREESAASAFVDPRKLTVRTMSERWLVKREAEVGTPGGVRRNTVNGYRSALSSLLVLLGDSPVRDVTPDGIEAALRTLATVGGKWGRPLSHRSLTYALGALRQVFAYGRRCGWVKVNPATEARAPGKAATVASPGAGAGAGAAVKRWTPAQLVAFRQHVDALPLDAEPWLRVGMRLTLCGLRRSEVLGLDWERVTASGAVTVAASRTKDGRGSSTSINGTKTDNSRRTVQADTIHPGTAKALRALWLAQGRPAVGLVIRDNLGQPVRPDAFSRRFRALCGAAGVPYLARIHNTRHTLATALQDAGVPDHQAAALLGHDVATYRRFYLVTDDDGAAEAAQVAGRLFAV